MYYNQILIRSEIIQIRPDYPNCVVHPRPRLIIESLVQMYPKKKKRCGNKGHGGTGRLRGDFLDFHLEP